MHSERNPAVMRVRHQGLRVDVTTPGPVPHGFVDPQGWFRGGAMMALAFRETGNLDCLRGWILGLPDPFVGRRLPDGDSAWFGMDSREGHVAGEHSDDRGDHPCFGGAHDYFHGAKQSPISDRDYPLTWETRARPANDDGIKRGSPVYAKQRTASRAPGPRRRSFFTCTALESTDR